ncbi:MAG: hypothetical protein H6942_03475 [Candidatus Accumulibacter sp.]|uniref:hypothetical protein n=1 Tax=Accumulibacter sp. TaxID=2053492 RepID=UPI0019FBA477|nr:hypothetical protein [Accumulibacter sp.]MBE2259126.1 hypothetical protein [Paracoccaceae bacterium]MCP5247598.1 hypothetical protein [Accumulibacter sp.]
MAETNVSPRRSSDDRARQRSAGSGFGKKEARFDPAKGDREKQADQQRQEHCHQGPEDHVVGKRAPCPTAQTEVIGDRQAAGSGRGIAVLDFFDESKAAFLAAEWRLVLQAKGRSFLGTAPPRAADIFRKAAGAFHGSTRDSDW